MMVDQTPTLPVGRYIQEELIARDWTRRQLAEKMGGDIDLNNVVVDLMIFSPSKDIVLGEDVSIQLGKAFGVSSELFINIDEAYRK